MKSFNFIKHHLIFVFIIFLVFSAMAQDYQVNEPRQIILTWQNNPQTTMTITWRTDQEGENNVVYYSPNKDLVFDHSESKKATTYTFEETSAWLHTAELTDLKPGNTYWVILESDGFQSEKFNFKTAPADYEDIVFIVGSDAQHLRTQMHVIRPVLTKAAQENPDFFVYSGDFVNAELSEYEWDLFFDLWDELMITEEKRRIPIIPAIGNHEVVAGYGGNREKSVFYFNRFKIPEPKDYYAIQYGPELTILSLNTDHTAEIGGEQLRWLEQTLQEHEDSKWIMAHYHDGGWWGTSKTNVELRSKWLPLFEEYGVDLAHDGHIHTYIRTFPIYGFKAIADDIDNMINEGLKRAKEDFDPKKNYAPPLQKNLIQLSRGKWEESGYSSLKEGFKELIYMLSLFAIQQGKDTEVAVFDQVCTTQLFEDYWEPFLKAKTNDTMINGEKGIIYFGAGGLGASMDPKENSPDTWWLDERAAIHHYYKIFIDASNNELNLTPIFYYPEDEHWEKGKTDIISR